MASVDELQDELVRQSSARLDAEHERTRLEEQLRKLVKENQALKEENAVHTQHMEEMENEMADLSSSLVEEANVKVAEANRKVASAQRMVSERDTLLEIQASQLQEIKHMMAQQEEATTQRRGPRRTRRPSYRAKLDADTILDLDSYASPVRPLLRLDTREFREFCEIFPTEGAARSFHFSLEALEAPAWRRSRFVTRLIQEDIEPALRLDRAAHMNWLTCRAFLGAVLDQTLILEPVSSKERPWAHRPSHPCLLCGENRSELIYSRYFWARTTPEAEPLVLDLACLAKVRLACELVGFVRSITDSKPGHNSEQQEQAWRECTSLREQLFWARTGGLYPEAGEAGELGDDDDAGIAHENADDDQLKNVPGQLSTISTPQLAQGGFAVGSPANTISSAVLQNAVPQRPTNDGSNSNSNSNDSNSNDSNSNDSNSNSTKSNSSSSRNLATSHKPYGADNTSTRRDFQSITRHSQAPRTYTWDSDAGSTQRNVPIESTQPSAATDLPGTSPTDTIRNDTATTAITTSTTELTGSGPDFNGPTSPTGSLHLQSPPRLGHATTRDETKATISDADADADADAGSKGLAVANTKNTNSITPTDAQANTKTRGAATEHATIGPDSEAEFHFDDDEFHSPAGTPDPTPGETMPGGWPG